MAHLGAVTRARESERGLEIEAEISDPTPFAAQVKRLLQQRRVKEFSFAYDTVTERKASDGANELIELDLIECGPCLKGANPETGLLSAKALTDMLTEGRGTDHYTRKLDALSPPPRKTKVPGAIDAASFIRTEYQLARLARQEREALGAARARDAELREQNFSEAELQALLPAHRQMDVEPDTVVETFSMELPITQEQDIE
jgi:hypothetical protein